MGLQDTVSASASAFIAAAAELVTDASLLGAIINGPASGSDSLVTVDSGQLKTLARVIAEAIGRLGPFRGNWAAGTAYAAGDAVRRSNKIYVAMLASTGVDPTGQTNGPQWFLFVDPQTAFDTVVGAFAVTSDITPTALAADANDYAPTGLSTATVLRLSGTAARTITGLDGGADGRILALVNVGSYAMTLPAESSASTAGMRFGFPGTLTLGPSRGALIQYDATASRWRLLAGVTDDQMVAIDARLSHMICN